MLKYLILIIAVFILSKDILSLSSDKKIFLKNTFHGFELKYPSKWIATEDCKSQNLKKMCQITFQHNNEILTFRSTNTNWSDLLPLIHLKRLKNKQEIFIDGVNGFLFDVDDGRKYITLTRENIVYEFAGEKELVDILIAEFKFADIVPLQKKKVEFTRPDTKALPKEVALWLKNAKKIDTTRFATSYVFAGKQYIFARSDKNKKHNVKILNVLLEDGKEIIVEVDFKKQQKGKVYDVIFIDDFGLPLKFVQKGDDEYMSIYTLSGTEKLKNIVAESRLIKIFSPAPGAIAKNRITVCGISIPPEGTINYRLTDKNKKVIKDGFITTQVNNNWNYFEFSIPTSEIKTKNALLQLYIDDFETGKKESIFIPLKIK